MAGWPHYNLTTFRQPVDEIVRVVVEMIEGDTSALLRAATTIRLSGELVERRSTGVEQKAR
jgi:DNA-binding LacI/PurR family transcriptional regulator